MIIFVLLNLLCFIIILSKCIWADKASWNRTAHSMISVFTPYHPQVEFTQLKDEDDIDEELDDCKDCEHCSRYNGDSGDSGDSGDDDSNNNPLTDSSISTPSVVQEVQIENPENYSVSNSNSNSNSNSGSVSGSESDDSIVILDTSVNYLKQAQDIVQGLKDELEKKND